MSHEITSQERDKDSKKRQALVFVDRRTLAVLFLGKKNRLITKTREETEIVNHISSPGDTECGTLKMHLAPFYLHCRMQSSQLPIMVLISQMEKDGAQRVEAIFPRTQSKGVHINISSSILRHSLATLFFF